MYAKFQFHSLYGFWGEDFSTIYPLCYNGNQSNSAIWTKIIWIVKDYPRNISEKKNLNICSETANIATFHLSHYKSMETISCHSNQSSYPIGTKKHNYLSPPPDLSPPPPDYLKCYMWNMERIGFTASEKKSIENVDGRTDAWCLLPIFTISSPLSSGELTIHVKSNPQYLSFLSKD